MNAKETACPEELLGHFPLKPHELLSDRSDRVYKGLDQMLKRARQEWPLWLVTDKGHVQVTPLHTLMDVEKKEVVNRIAGATLLLPPMAGGLSKEGQFNGKVAHTDNHPHDYDVAHKWREESGEVWRCRCWDEEEAPPNMALVHTIDTPANGRRTRP